VSPLDIYSGLKNSTCPRCDESSSEDEDDPKKNMGQD
jgi:hypothetical protein